MNNMNLLNYHELGGMTNYTKRTIKYFRNNNSISIENIIYENTILDYRLKISEEKRKKERRRNIIKEEK